MKYRRAGPFQAATVVHAPYIYSETEIAAIVEEAARLPSIYGMRGLTCSTLFGFIAAAGLRISEALGLDTGDVDLDEGVLRIRCRKLGNEHPMAASVVERLHAYARERDRLLGLTPEPFFVACGGNRLGDCGARYYPGSGRPHRPCSTR